MTVMAVQPLSLIEPSPPTNRFSPLISLICTVSLYFPYQILYIFLSVSLHIPSHLLSLFLSVSLYIPSNLLALFITCILICSSVYPSPIFFISLLYFISEYNVTSLLPPAPILFPGKSWTIDLLMRYANARGAGCCVYADWFNEISSSDYPVTSSRPTSPDSPAISLTGSTVYR